MKLPLPERHRKRMVIDADVARAASPSNSTEAGQCFKFLVAFQKCHHKAVFSNELWGEWLENRSRYAWRWMREMRGRRLVVRIPDPADTALRMRIHQIAESTAALEAMNKDVHLLEAALTTDRIVASKEKEAHTHFAGVCDRIGEIRDIVWINPVVEEDACAGWLKQGAPEKQHRQLGFQHRKC